ncbi:efflux RND transporter periplasmic adaptor subunit [Thermovirga sp.]|uniref:efflux RND transporter periplasmic adaptor subunit n=1 Tax=Thermovirga sp. TaxID=2699834 RepID=UPI0025D70116|nr:efflux RND transporter periplasmic adaptor subunit [Thermovirga sp.]MBO8154355.1 efflux RND transporter periplasmic adaptor subunit [Thermovirga sp.]
MKKWIVFICIFLLLGSLMWYRGHQKSQRENAVVEVEKLPVEVISLQDRVFEDVLKFTATIEPENQAAVVSKVAGRTVLDVKVDVGDYVKKGEILAILDSSIVDQQLADAMSRYEKAKADYERYKNLYEEEVISKQQFEQARTLYIQAKTALKQVRILKGYHVLRAPVEGVVALRAIDPGDTSSSSSAAFLINQQKAVKIVGAVPEKQYPKVRLGQEGMVSVDALDGETFKAKVTRISPSLDPVTRTGLVELKLPSRGKLKPGMYARVAIILGQRQVKALPREAVRSLAGTGERTCFVVSDDTAIMRILETGEEQGRWVEVNGGVTQKELIIATNSSKLADGTKVEVTNR